MALVWLDSMALGVPIIDAEHRAMLELLAEAVRAGERNDAAAAHAGMEAVLAAMACHFEGEEALMRGHGYPKAEVHIRLHQETLVCFRAALAEAGRGDLAAFHAAISSAIDIFLRRLLIDDRDWVSFVEISRLELYEMSA